MASSPASATPAYVMTPLERRASLSLAGLFALRMLGLFLVLPVFALEAARYPGGDDTFRVGLAMGIYGLTQALLQIPLGMASDRFGRKRVIVGGLVLFAVGSVIAAMATTLDVLTLGRAIQGAGAISAAITALLADSTRDEVRTKAMALVGISIALMFALSLVGAPLLAARIGLSGLLGLTAVLAVLGIALVVWVVPDEPLRTHSGPAAPLTVVLRHPGLLRLNLGVFVLHAVQLAMWMAVPALLVQSGLAPAQHWTVYLLALVGSFMVMGAVLFKLERKGYLRAMFIVAISLILVVQLGLAWSSYTGEPSLNWLAIALFMFFLGFNTLEASQPSLASRLAPAHSRGSALGIYNTLQSVGFFVGGSAGGWALLHLGASGLFMACAGLTLVWLVAAWGMKAPPVPGSAPHSAHSGPPRGAGQP